MLVIHSNRQTSEKRFDILDNLSLFANLAANQLEFSVFLFFRIQIFYNFPLNLSTIDAKILIAKSIQIFILPFYCLSEVFGFRDEIIWDLMVELL